MEFMVAPPKVRRTANEMDSCRKKVHAVWSDVERVKKRCSIEGKYRVNVLAGLSVATRELTEMEQSLRSMSEVLDEIADTYENTEKQISGREGKIWKVVLEKINFPIPSPGENPFMNVEVFFTEKMKEYFTDIEEEDFLSIVKTLLNGADKYGDNDEAGVLKDVISYIQNFVSFFIGDKKGISGASDWCNLADSSIGLWTGMYDYFQNMYDGLKTGLFGDIAQKNVKVLGVSAGFLGLIGSILSASNGLKDKQWQNAVADYVDCGNNLLSIISSGYSLKHIGDVKSLIEMKAGPWNALNIYLAIAEAGIQSVSQGFRSYGKYYADRQWDLGDTGATGIDITMAGIYGISHSLTLGLDDLIYGAVDSASGGNGTTDMNYFEKSAEGYKILANKVGEHIGNWWINLTT